MTALPSGLLPETAKTEETYAVVKKKLDKLQSRYEAQELKALAEYESRVKEIESEYEKQRDALTQLNSPMRATFEKILKEKRNLEISELQRLFKEGKETRYKIYDEERRRYRDEAFMAMNALMSAGPGPMLEDLPMPPSLKPGPGLSEGFANTASRPGTPSPPRVSSMRREQTETPSKSSRSTSLQTYTNGSHALVPDLVQQSAPVSSRASLAPPVSPIPSAKNGGESQKRKSPNDSTESSPECVKRTKLVQSKIESSASEPPSPTALRAPKAHRTITFAEVYGEPGGEKPKYKHIIVEFPPRSNRFYILKCDEHGVHFGENPLRGAAKHLASAQHGNMSKAHTTAIETLGFEVVDCTSELMEKNNAEVMQAFRENYKPFNANHLSQAKRAELGFPPLETPNWQKAASQRAAKDRSANAKKQGSVTHPEVGRFYVARTETKCPVLILPKNDLAPVGLQGTLASTGIFSDSDMFKLPKCYTYEKDGNNRVLGIAGWAPGYEDGGPLVKKREFPVLVVNNPDPNLWNIGFIEASSLAELDFNDENSRYLPFFKEARDYYFNRILPHRRNQNLVPPSFYTEHYGSPTPHQNGQSHHQSFAESDIEMRDVGAPDDADRFSNHGSILSKHPSGVASAPLSPVAAARVIAAQALELQAPTPVRAFTPINAPSPQDVGSRNVSPNPEALSGALPTQTSAPVRKPSPASIENILQEFPRQDAPKATRKPLPSTRPNPGSPPRASFVAINHAAQPLREARAGSVPLAENRRLPNVASEPMRHSAPQSPALTSVSVHIPEQSLQRSPMPSPPPSTTMPQMPVPQSQPTPQPTRANSPTLGYLKPLTPISTSLAKIHLEPLTTNNSSLSPGETPTSVLSTVIVQSDIATPTISSDVFDVFGLVENNVELFPADITSTPFVRLVTDNTSGVISSVPDAPVQVIIDPRNIKLVERTQSRDGATCMVNVTYHSTQESGKLKTHTLVFEKVRQEGGYGGTVTNGAVHARRFCRRVHEWNDMVELPPPKTLSEGQELVWRPRNGGKTELKEKKDEAAQQVATVSAA